MTRYKASKAVARRGRGAGKRTASKRAGQPRKKASRDLPRPVAGTVEIREIESLRAELKRIGAAAHPPRWNANPDDVRRSVVKLVLTLVEFVRQLLERQAIRRVDAGTLTSEETEAVGLALMRLEETIRDLGEQFEIAPEDLNLDLGPVGRLI